MRNKELEEALENNTPLVIFPFGKSNPDVARVIAQGKLYPDCFYFFDVGWNAPGAGTGTEHYISADKVEGPIDVDTDKVDGYSRRWKIGKAEILQVEDEQLSPEYGNVDLYVEAEINQRLTTPEVRKQAVELLDGYYDRRKKFMERQTGLVA